MPMTSSCSPRIFRMPSYAPGIWSSGRRRSVRADGAALRLEARAEGDIRRRLTALHFDRVLAVKSAGIDRSASEAPLTCWR